MANQKRSDEGSRFRDLAPRSEKEDGSSSQAVLTGVPVPKTKRIEIFSSEEWEEFTEEWASSLSDDYDKVQRFAGSGDSGLDVVGFQSAERFEGIWDNYQCKHYDHTLRPSDIWIEIGKIIYYSFTEEFTIPRKSYFVAPKGMGTTLAKLLAKPDQLKEKARENWDKHCETKITESKIVGLSGDLLAYFDAFNFAIFDSKSSVELIKGHSTTPFHSVRFGGGLPKRPDPELPPEQPGQLESRYIEQIFEAYSDQTGDPFAKIRELNAHPDLKEDFLRQRTRFYSAEALRNFARDTVPEGTFEDLSDQVHQGVVDVAVSTHDDGLARMRATLAQAASTSVGSSPLTSVTKTQDKQGVCHQLANHNKLVWVPGEKK